MAYFAKETGLYTIGFSISALLLIFALNDPAFPATHHTTLVAGYAIAQTGNILIAVHLGVLRIVSVYYLVWLLILIVVHMLIHPLLLLRYVV